MAGYWLTGYKLSDFSGALANNTGATVGSEFVGTSVSVSPVAETITFEVDDDDDMLEDAYRETGRLATLEEDLTLDGVTYPAELSHIECEFRLTTDDDPPINFHVGRIGTGSSNSGENIFVFTDAPLEPGKTYSFNSYADGQSTPYDVICFAAGTLIDTLDGPVAVEDLCSGDRVLTRDSGVQTILWAGQRKLSRQDLSRAPHLAPIRIRRGALGEDLPARDLVVSPQHRLVIDDWRAEHYFGETSVLAPAKALFDGRNVTIDRYCDGVIYCHILLKRHELVRANGQWAETLLLGPMASQILGKDQLSEIEEIFPEVRGDHRFPACPVLSTSESFVLHG